MLRNVSVRTPVTSGTEHRVAFARALRRAVPQIERHLPWTGHESPWAILVSEFMLQQTSVARVRDAWERFLALYPTPADCARAPQSAIIRQWQGLGYPRRAVALHHTARLITARGGEVPQSLDDLMQLPGVGNYTARAIASFAFGERVGVVDTNVGRVLARAVVNRPLRPTAAQELADSFVRRGSSARWNQAMLDIGAQWCRARPQCATCPVRTACRWRIEGGDDPAVASAGVSRPQSRFEGSARQQRGRVLRRIGEGGVTSAQLARTSGIDESRLESTLSGLVRDGLITRRGRQFVLSD